MKDFLVKAGIATLAYFSPLYEMFIVMMFFVLADLISGVVASNKRGVPRSSRRLRKSVVKLVCYISAMMLAYSAEQSFQVEWFTAHRAVGAFICAVEFISILENFAVITGHPAFLKIVKWIRGKISNQNNMINEIINEKNDIHNTYSNTPSTDSIMQRSQTLTNNKSDSGETI